MIYSGLGLALAADGLRSCQVVRAAKDGPPLRGPDPDRPPAGALSPPHVLLGAVSDHHQLPGRTAGLAFAECKHPRVRLGGAGLRRADVEVDDVAERLHGQGVCVPVCQGADLQAGSTQGLQRLAHAREERGVVALPEPGLKDRLRRGLAASEPQQRLTPDEGEVVALLWVLLHRPPHLLPEVGLLTEVGVDLGTLLGQCCLHGFMGCSQGLHSVPQSVVEVEDHAPNRTNRHRVCGEGRRKRAQLTPSRNR
mmetsp:Transcript_52227/g.151763  ORF Transcript_52227/g.151763 Transcript_52227/m.151763 type:complete len:252 (-) Transcript_52227:8-763(-)